MKHEAPSIYRPAVHARWCADLGHRWEWDDDIVRERGRIHLWRRCLRCGKGENHTSELSVAGTEKKPVGWR